MAFHLGAKKREMTGRKHPLFLLCFSCCIVCVCERASLFFHKMRRIQTRGCEVLNPDRYMTVADMWSGHGVFRHVITRDSFEDTDPSAHNFT